MKPEGGSLFFAILFLLVLFQRAIELGVANRNAAAIRSQGGYEVGKEHYKYLVLLHTAFFLSLSLEVALLRGRGMPTWWSIPFTLFLLAQMGRFWAIHSLGVHWNTRIFILPGSPPAQKGPYLYLKHPNYAVVMTEMLMLPLTFGAWRTALVFSLANAFLLCCVRIPAEEAAWREVGTPLGGRQKGESELQSCPPPVPPHKR